MSATGKNVKSGAGLGTPERLAWQGELDSAMSNIDSRLRHPRRRANDSAEQPGLPQLGQVEITSELLDEIAWRVAEQIRRSQAPPPSPAASTESAGGTAANPALWKSTPQWPDAFEPKPEPEPAPKSTAAVVIRLRRPLFRWPFRRRQITSIGGYRAT